MTGRTLSPGAYESGSRHGPALAFVHVADDWSVRRGGYLSADRDCRTIRQQWLQRSTHRGLRRPGSDHERCALCRRALRHLRRVRAESTEAHETAFIGRPQPYGQSVTRRDGERRERWAITRATCATSSSTSSKCSTWRRHWSPASSATSTASRCARCSTRRRGLPRARWRRPSPTATATRQRSTPPRTRSPCPSPSRSRSGRGGKGSGSGSVWARQSAACPRPRCCPGRSTSLPLALSRRRSCIWPAR
jgi:hypothetical protein